MEENEGYGIRPAPGTCCPDMRIKDGVCQGCGKVYAVKVKVFVECPEKGSVPISECVECEFFDSLNPVEAVYCKNLRFKEKMTRKAIVDMENHKIYIINIADDYSSKLETIKVDAIIIRRSKNSETYLKNQP